MLAGNPGRCTGYHFIVEAIAAAARVMGRGAVTDGLLPLASAHRRRPVFIRSRVMAGTKRADAAHQFINMVLSKEIQSQLVESLRAGPVNAGFNPE